MIKIGLEVSVPRPLPPPRSAAALGQVGCYLNSCYGYNRVVYINVSIPFLHTSIKQGRQ